ncbi:MAG TPA: hypothetical protein VKH46_03325 [Thermoanaerobaculia bacterium]|jgi:uncharacterized membrane protein YbaN (DUF454 family)|nr:hypothetical protein [Thermoanaerobaculia bacterium]
MTEPRRRRRRPLHQAIRDWPGAVRITLAVLCLLVGLAGVVIPILPGWPFLFVGLAILTTVFPGLQRFWRARMRKHPRLRKVLKKVQTKKPNA